MMNSFTATCVLLCAKRGQQRATRERQTTCALQNYHCKALSEKPNTITPRLKGKLLAPMTWVMDAGCSWAPYKLEFLEQPFSYAPTGESKRYHAYDEMKACFEFSPEVGVKCPWTKSGKPIDVQASSWSALNRTALLCRKIAPLWQEMAASQTCHGVRMAFVRCSPTSLLCKVPLPAPRSACQIPGFKAVCVVGRKVGSP